MQGWTLAQVTMPAQLDQTVAGVPLWIWVVGAVVVVALIVAFAVSRRKKRQAIIKTRLG